MNVADSPISLKADALESPVDDIAFSRILRSAAILIVDNESGIRDFLCDALAPRCALLELAGSAEEAEAVRLRYHFDLLLVDISLPGLSGIDWLGRLRERGVRTHVIYTTANANLEMAVSALRIGADDFIMKPFSTKQILTSIRRTLTRSLIVRENSLLRLQIQQMHTDEEFIGDSAPVKQMLQHARQVAMSGSRVLICGENGTGKSLLSRTIHNLGRCQGRFVRIRCNALQGDSEQAELFGQAGLLASARKGTLVLVDVEHLSPACQNRLVEILESGQFKAAGFSQPERLDVRVIATTSVDLAAAVSSGRFNSDLYYLLSVLPLNVPALRHRGQDIELLAEMFLRTFSSEHRLAPTELLHEDWQHLAAYHWPGNVLELRTVMERCVLLGHLPLESLKTETHQAPWTGPGFPVDFDLQTVERAHIEAVLESVGNNKSAAARILGVSRKTLERKQALWYGAAKTE